MKKKYLTALAAAGALVVSAVGLVPANAAETGPFTVGTHTYCPSYQTTQNCTGVQTRSQYDVAFDPADVTVSGSTISLAIEHETGEDGEPGIAGAFNDYGYTSQYISAGSPGTYEEWADLTLPCNASGQVENWPAFWLDGTSPSSWPQHGEIDVMEGLNGTAQWHIHAENAAGTGEVSIGGTYTGSVCGSHYYTVIRSAGQVQFEKDSVVMGTVTTASFPQLSSIDDPMYTLFDYASGSYGGPQADATMTVSHLGWYSGS